MKAENSLRKRSSCGDVEEQSLLSPPSDETQVPVSLNKSAAQWNISLKRKLSYLMHDESRHLMTSSILFFLLSLIILSLSVKSSSGTNRKTELSPTQTWNYPDRIFGLAHIAKTAGTNLNGNLSMHYERICGNKGYSLDAIGANERFIQSNQTSVDKVKDSYTRLERNYNRGISCQKSGFMIVIGSAMNSNGHSGWKSLQMEPMALRLKSMFLVAVP